MSNEKIIISDISNFGETATHTFASKIKQAAMTKSRVNIALSGGSTPLLLYRALQKKNNIPWEKTSFYFSDERYVPSNHPDSNFFLAKKNLFIPLNIPHKHTHPMHIEGLSPNECATHYSKLLLSHISLKQDTPVFDIVLLGVGDDGHTASIFPSIINELSNRPAQAHYVNHLNAWRITLSLHTINSSDNILVLAAGTKKAEIVKETLQKKKSLELPIQLINQKKCTWILDKAASSRLSHHVRLEKHAT